MDLNHPIAVVAILAGITVAMREIFFFARTISKARNGKHNEERLMELLEKINNTLTLLTERSKKHWEDEERQLDEIERYMKLNPRRLR